MSKPIRNFQLHKDLKGLSQLSQDGIIGMVDLVEAIQQRIYTLGGLLNQGDIDKTSGLSGFIYKAIRKTTQLSIKSIDFALATFSPLLPTYQSYQQNNKWRNQWVSILNGVLGDHLLATQNPLAIEMTLTYQGQTITPLQAADICNELSCEPLLLIHGLCMNDQQWLHNKHDHGTQLAESSRFIPFYVRYNSGLAIFQNGKLLAQVMNEFIGALSRNQACHILCHSMGGLVARSAMQSTESKNTWLDQLGKIVFLGTPHNGAVLEKSGHLLDYVLSISPYSAPFTKLTGIRSQGIKDLRDGRTNEEHLFKPVTKNINLYAIAGSDKNQTNTIYQKVIGDGLVSVSSALGQHKQSDKQLNLLADHQIIVEGVNHMSLLSNPKVFKHLSSIFKN